MVLEMLSVYPKDKSFPFGVQSMAHGLPKAEMGISRVRPNTGGEKIERVAPTQFRRRQ
jgi:hypothetical protein